MAGFFQFGLLLVCWLTALATLLVFLESWFAFSGRHRFQGRRASGTYGIVSVFIPLQGSVEKLDRIIRSVLNQTYPFIEIVLIYCEDDLRYVNLSRELRGVRTHVPIRVVLTTFSIETETDRIRALEQAHSSARGRWWVVLRPDTILDSLAIESTLEFAGSNEVTAMALQPGTHCTSLVERLLAPSMEYLLQMLRVADQRRERARKLQIDSSYLLVNREAFEVVNRINRMPGILNEAGWTVSSYQIEGLRIFEGDGSRWMWREASIRSWIAEAHERRRRTVRSAGLVLASVFITVISVFGIAYGLTGRLDNFSGTSILAFSAVSYGLMAVSYFLYARRLHAASWFAPLWFVSHIPACVLTVVQMRRPNGGAGASPLLSESSRRAGDPGCRTR